MRSLLRQLPWPAILLAGVLVACGGGSGAPAPATPVPLVPFQVHAPDAGFVAPAIVLHHDPVAGTGFDWDTVRARATASNLKVFYRDEDALAWGAAAYLEEGIRRMTGRSLTTASGPDISRGIVLLTLAGAPPALRSDPEIVAALRNDGQDGYNDVEAYYIRTEADRILLVANKAAGLINAVVELLESADYEVLGMGPNWTHVPDRTAGLSFALRTAGRPSWYLREPQPTSGQYYGVGTVYAPTLTPLSDPADEYVQDSYWRWRVGTRTWGQSMPPFPGHALQAHHAEVVAEMIARGATEGFLAPTSLGLDADRPAAAPANAGTLWINTDAAAPEAGLVFISTGSTWSPQNLAALQTSLDLSVPFVRDLILQDLKDRADAFFAASPDGLFVYGTDPEDGGGYASFPDHAYDPTWYADYRAASGDPLGAPYALHGMFGLDQPTEVFDPTSVADSVYGFNDWLLREYDNWLATLPPADQLTSTGVPKRERVRASFQSYNYHDVPPGFHLDPRMRVMVAGYPKNRGRGRWAGLASPADVASAMRVLLPREPSALYSIYSLSFYFDFGLGGVQPTISSATAAFHPAYSAYHDAGVRGLTYEMDFNFGKEGLTYYLTTKMLWDADASESEIEALRTRWFQRAFGSGWEPMRAYYDLLTPEAFYANTETLWATAVDLIVAADALIDAGAEPAAQRRLDDVKQYWYYHYLTVSGLVVATNPDLQTFAWKGQMSYQTAMHVIFRRVFGKTFIHEALDPALTSQPAHYTAAETEAWWSLVRDAWEVVPVTLFADVTLADGSAGRDADLNDLVWTDELVAAGGRIGIPADRSFLYNSSYQDTVSLLTTAEPGDPIGFSMSWSENVERFPTYGIDRWDPVARTWEGIVDPSTSFATPQYVPSLAINGLPGWIASFTMPAPQAGTYRIALGRGGNVAQATGVGHDFVTAQYDALRPCTYFQYQDGLTQSYARPVLFLYIPRGVPSLDLEMINDNASSVELYGRGVVTGAAYGSRVVDITGRGTKVVPLMAGEDGGIAGITLSGFQLPYFYSVPQRWARSPVALLVPRAVAAADGLTPR